MINVNNAYSFDDILTVVKAKRSGKYTIPIHDRGSKIPFFAIPGYMLYVNVGAYIEKDQPFYTLEQPPHAKMQDIISHYLNQIRAVQPHGPYCLGGFCRWGKMALKVAKELHAQGERILLIVLIESYHPVTLLHKNSNKYVYVRLRAAIHELKNSSSFYHFLKIILERPFRLAIKYFLVKIKVLLSLGKKSSVHEHFDFIENAVLFKAKKERSTIFKDDVYMGWSNSFTGYVETNILDADHMSMFKNPEAYQLGEKLNAALKRVNGELLTS